LVEETNDSGWFSSLKYYVAAHTPLKHGTRCAVAVPA
jgi:hypothetical protein